MVKRTPIVLMTALLIVSTTITAGIDLKTLKFTPEMEAKLKAMENDPVPYDMTPAIPISLKFDIDVSSLKKLDNFKVALIRQRKAQEIYARIVKIIKPYAERKEYIDALAKFDVEAAKFKTAHTTDLEGAYMRYADDQLFRYAAAASSVPSYSIGTDAALQRIESAIRPDSLEVVRKIKLGNVRPLDLLSQIAINMRGDMDKVEQKNMNKYIEENNKLNDFLTNLILPQIRADLKSQFDSLKQITFDDIPDEDRIIMPWIRHHRAVINMLDEMVFRDKARIYKLLPRYQAIQPKEDAADAKQPNIIASIASFDLILPQVLNTQGTKIYLRSPTKGCEVVVGTEKNFADILTLKKLELIYETHLLTDWDILAMAGSPRDERRIITLDQNIILTQPLDKDKLPFTEEMMKLSRLLFVDSCKIALWGGQDLSVRLVVKARQLVI